VSERIETNGQLEVEVERAGVTVTAKVAGELDSHTAPQLQQALAGVLDSGAKRLVLDVAEVGFVDSSGLRVLIGLRQQLGGGVADVELVHLSPSFRRLLELTGLLGELAPNAD
jgi:anti-anti-sigma factor